MVLHVPFRRWVHVKYQNPQPLHGGFYCLLPVQGRRVIAAVARYRHPGQLEYKALSIFVCEYADILGLGDNLIWAGRDDLVKWLDALVHNSFMRHSTPGVERCWYIKHMSQLYVFTPTMDFQRRLESVLDDLNLEFFAFAGTRILSSLSFPYLNYLRSWYVVNASKIRELPTTPAQLLLPNPTEESQDNITKIANLPVIVHKAEFLTVKGIVRVMDFGQKFYYLACSLCSKATNAYGDDSFWCNYCLQKVPALTDIKFNVQVTDSTGNIEATVFSEVASQVYNLTAADLIDGQVLLPVLHKLSEPKEATITLKAHMYNYAGVSQIKFKVHSISTKDMTESENRSEELLLLASNAPNKKTKTAEHNASSSSFETVDAPPVNSPTEKSVGTAEETSKSDNNNK
ncbi:hypothetical protein RHMOL_Rhmol02G0121500 [Rhododendron molle]|uniref:Uncharacterized protein n=1 Tax=Rhododendron molle TaxID=49168 RepID=A0ACC0PQU5_RHOML|nr:hypothetical protein RHMOL_Rhmol02G0121500 [Rhododendron molle]